MHVTITKSLYIVWIFSGSGSTSVFTRCQQSFMMGKWLGSDDPRTNMYLLRDFSISGMDGLRSPLSCLHASDASMLECFISAPGITSPASFTRTPYAGPSLSCRPLRGRTDCHSAVRSKSLGRIDGRQLPRTRSVVLELRVSPVQFMMQISCKM